MWYKALVEGLLRYLAETGRNRARPRVIAGHPRATASTGGAAAQPAQRRAVREQYLAALSADRVVFCDVSATAGVEHALDGRIRTADLERVVRAYASAGVGAASSLEVVSPGSLSAILALGESPLTRLERLAAAAPEVLLEATIDATTGLGTRPVAETVLREAAFELGRAGAGLIRVREAANRVERLQAALAAAARTDALVEVVVVLAGDVPGTRLDGMMESMKKLASAGAAILGIEDPRGALRPLSAYGLVRTLRRELPALPVRLRAVDSVGISVATAVAAAEAGVGAVTVVQLPLARPHAPPAASALAYALGSTERAPAITEQALSSLRREWSDTLETLGPWRIAQREHDAAPAEIPTRESIPPRAAGDLDAIVRRRAQGAGADGAAADRASRNASAEAASRTASAETASRNASAETASRNASAETASRNASAETASRNASAETADAVRDAILEAHDPAAFQRRRSSLERYGQLGQLPTHLFLDGLLPGEDAIVPAPNGGGERHVVFRSLEGLLASFEVDGVDLEVSLTS